MSPPNYSPSPLYFPILPLLPLLLLTTFIYQTSASFPIALRQTSTEYTDDRAFKNAVLNTSNYYRAQHNASALSWNESLADFAQEWGNGCVFMHSVSLC
ncbi:hypothetical protein K432DRAFT_379040 [Lepidopterella palustris CBS 459.81]|uniref:SCP domain-containing protein n=1 Tax=Lepidopterella palustris CBS 459.81 TaxID=1314670 RepID=A0A8E2JIG9_9PEZI|nr:hypothetical protein K432DRAFT_379040 [Lepidopterella palustris CBS 459.81]